MYMYKVVDNKTVDNKFVYNKVVYNKVVDKNDWFQNTLVQVD